MIRCFPLWYWFSLIVYSALWYPAWTNICSMLYFGRISFQISPLCPPLDRFQRMVPCKVSSIQKTDCSSSSEGRLHIVSVHMLCYVLCSTCTVWLNLSVSHGRDSYQQGHLQCIFHQQCAMAHWCVALSYCFLFSQIQMDPLRCPKAREASLSWMSSSSFSRSAWSTVYLPRIEWWCLARLIVLLFHVRDKLLLQYGEGHTLVQLFSAFTQMCTCFCCVFFHVEAYAIVCRRFVSPKLQLSVLGVLQTNLVGLLDQSSWFGTGRYSSGGGYMKAGAFKL